MQARPERNRRSWYNTIAVLAMAIASCAIALFVAEKIVGVTHPQLTYSRAQAFSFKATSKSDYLPFTLRPNHSSIHTASDGEFSYAVKINSLGYRMDEFPAQKPNGEFRILILGDSMTFGWGVDVKDNLPSKLEALINSRLPRENRSKRYVRIINAGFKNARSPDAFYLYLKKEGLTLDPDLIIMNYFPANDIEDLDDTEWEKVDGSNLPEKIVSKRFYVDGDDLRLRPEYRKLEHAFPLLRDSNLWVLFVDTVEARLPKVANLMKRWVGIRDYLASNPGENNRCVYDQICTPRMEALFAKFERLVLATYNLAKGKDVPLVVGLLPAARQVRKAVRQTKSSDGEGGLPGCRIGQSAECQPQKRIKTYLSAHGIAYIDALPYVVANDWRAYYLRRDGHPTAAGNERFAQAYFDYLTNQWHVLAKLQPN